MGAFNLLEAKQKALEAAEAQWRAQQQPDPYQEVTDRLAGRPPAPVDAVLRTGNPRSLPRPAAPSPAAPSSQPVLPPSKPNTEKLKPAGTIGGPPARTTPYQSKAGWSTTKLNDPTADSVKYQFGRFIQDQGISAAAARDPAVMQRLLDGFNRQYGLNARAVGDDSVDFGQPGWNTIDVLNGNDRWQWLTGNTGRAQAAAGNAAPAIPGQAPIYQAFGGNQSQAPGTATGMFGGQVFTDPATAQWEQITRMLSERLNQPRPLGYTESQQDLINTQALDPLEQQRQAQRQQTMQQFAARGITPGSGILEQALQDVDRQFNELRTKTQAGFAQNQIALEDNRFLGNEARALQGQDLFGQIPELADSRLRMAQSTLIPSDPAQLLGLQAGINAQGQQAQLYNQQLDQQFWNNLALMLGELF